MNLYLWADPVQVFLIPTLVVTVTADSWGIVLRFWHMAISLEARKG